MMRGLTLDVRDHFGVEVLEHCAAQADLTLADIDAGNCWVSLEQVEAMLAACFELYSNDAAFTAAFGHRLADSLGPMRFVAWAANPSTILRRAAQSSSQFSTFSRMEVLDVGRAHIHLRYHSERPESRLMCLSRQGMAGALPTLWGLPRANFEEESCIGWGDDVCEYRITWHQHQRAWPILLGAAVGGLVGGVLAGLGYSDSSLALTLLPVTGILAAYVMELRRARRQHLANVEDTQDALGDAVEEESAARREVMHLVHRQQEWTRLTEEYAAERTASLGRVVERLRQLQQARVRRLKGFTHDLNNPLAVLRGGLEQLHCQFGADLDTETDQLFVDLDDSIERIGRLLGDAISDAAADSLRIRHNPEPIVVDELRDALRRRLRALAFGKHIRISVLSAREAPATIQIDPVVLNRIVDNLLTNAVKYTDRGSIVVEVDGTPGFLTLKISDTGRGISEDRIERIFEARGSLPGERAADSYGLGLSVVVQLLADIGGRLEVISKPEVGTTFWLHLPEHFETGGSSIPPSAAAATQKVVRIRRSGSG